MLCSKTESAMLLTELGFHETERVVFFRKVLS